MSLERRIPDLVTSAEYQTLAFAHIEMGNYPAAKECQMKSISALDEIMCRRSDAYLLFNAGTFEGGRKQYGTALALFKVRDDQARFLCGVTYQWWGVNEMTLAKSKNRASDSFESAQTEFVGIDSEQFRNTALAGLEQAKRNVGLANPDASEAKAAAAGD
jgi:hypothetical protein